MKLRAPTTDNKLVFGDFVHQALAKYYQPGIKRGPLPSGTFEAICEKKLDGFDGIWADDEFMNLVELGVKMLERYVEHWQEADKEYRIIASEQTFQVPIGRVLGHKVFYVGTIDGVWKHLPTGKIRFAEHKTAASINQDALPMDEQVGAYWTYGPRWLRLNGFLDEGERLDGILYNWLRKALPPDKPTDALGRVLNQDGSISKRQPAKFFERKNTFRGDAEAERVKHRDRQQVRDMILAREDPEQHVYKNPGPQFLPNCKFCSFRDMCELHETGNDWEAFQRAAFGTWDPYDAHERVERR